MKVSRVIIRISIISVLLMTSSFLYNRGNARQPQQQSMALIFDLGGVLVDTNTMRTCWELGPRSVMHYWKNSKLGMKGLKKKFFKFLNRMTDSIGNPDGAKDEEGNLMPLLFCEWLKGHHRSKHLQDKILKALEDHPEWCKSSIECKLLKQLTLIIFNPKLFIGTRRLNPEGISFVKECKEKGYKLYILSNWDADSFEFLVSSYPDFFSLFDGFVISGYVYEMKPNKIIYRYFTNQTHRQWILIDDQQDNLDSAKECGIHGIHCKRQGNFFLGTKPNFKQVRKKLYQLESLLISN